MSGNSPVTQALREQAAACRRDHFSSWVVVQRGCNYSAFAGYRRTPSAYSLVRCNHCGRVWRTKAAYVRVLPDSAPPGSHEAIVRPAGGNRRRGG